MSVSVADICAQKPNIYRCIRSNCDRLGFYAKIQIIFGPVLTQELQSLSVNSINN